MDQTLLCAVTMDLLNNSQTPEASFLSKVPIHKACTFMVVF
jgi:hypothetical protein